MEIVPISHHFVNLADVSHIKFVNVTGVSSAYTTWDFHFISNKKKLRVPMANGVLERLVRERGKDCAL